MGCMYSIHLLFDELETFFNEFFKKEMKLSKVKKEYFKIKGDKDKEPTFQFIDISDDYSDI